MSNAARLDPDFPVQWDDPADAERCWRHDPLHLPNAVAPLEFELGLKPFLEGFGWGMRPRQFNYFVYFDLAPSGDGAAPSPPPRPDVEQVRDGGRRWRAEVLPEVLGHIERYRGTDFESMANDQLVAEIERLPELRFRSGQLHTMSITPHWMGMGLLTQTYRELTGGDELGAVRLVQGHGNKSFESGERLWRVSRIAASIPAVRERLLSVDADSARRCLAELEHVPEAAPFVEALTSYLDEYGWRSNAGFASPTWAEDPTVPLAILRAYLETDGYDPLAEQRRLAEEREAAIEETMAALDEAGRSRLREAIDAALEVVNLSEDHNFYIDQQLWCAPRRLLLAAAGRLVRAGALVEAGDVFFLHGAELTAGLRGETDGLAEAAPRRKAELARWRTVAPPRYVGAPPPAGLPEQEESPAREPGGELRGTAASAGVARGVVRVVRSLGEADRLKPGDVLVTQVTQPAWTPLFAVARAVVTEVGAVLSHTAIAAREYGIPAVVNVRDATRLLHDGQLVEVDGSAGVVRVVG